MFVIKGNKKIEISDKDLSGLTRNFQKVVLDIGTGDGRFIYENALKKPDVIFLGLDPAEKQLEIYSRKSNKKKLNNCIFIVGSIDNLPRELFSFIDEIYITLPWGTLLENVVKTDSDLVQKIYRLLKETGTFEIIFGYLSDLEPSETKRLNLPDTKEGLDINQVLIPLKTYFDIEEMKVLDKRDLGKLETTWAKKLKFGKNRTIFKIVMKKKA